MAMDRRQFMLGSGLGLLATAMPGFPVLANTAAPGRRRLVTVMLYGGMDGLAAVTPYGDIAMAQARRGTTIPRPGRGPGAGLDLDGFFSLHPAMAALKPHYDRGHLAIVHATGRSRSNGSHFLCQDEVQIGMQHQPNFRTDGWLNRAWGVLEGDRPILSMTRRVPLIARGSAPSVSYSKSSLPDVSAQDYARVASLYESNPKFQAAFREAGVAREIARKALAEARAKSRGKKSEFFARQRFPSRFSTSRRWPDASGVPASRTMASRSRRSPAGSWPAPTVPASAAWKCAAGTITARRAAPQVSSPTMPAISPPGWMPWSKVWARPSSKR